MTAIEIIEKHINIELKKLLRMFTTKDYEDLEFVYQNKLINKLKELIVEIKEQENESNVQNMHKGE